MPRPAPAPIDPRGPRTNQAVLAVALVAGAATGQRWVVPLFAVVLFLGAAFGPRYGPVLRLYQAFLRPRLGPPHELEDPRPPRFAAAVGVVFLAAATVAFALGAGPVGWGLALVVAALAGLAAVTGICIGCELYVLWVRLRGGALLVRVDRDDHGPGRRRATTGDEHLPAGVATGGRPAWVVFTTAYCAVCPHVVERLGVDRPDDEVVVVDVGEHPELAARFSVRRAPTVLRADADGAVVARLSGAEAVAAELDALEAAVGA